MPNPSRRAYLFRIDGARDNDEYFAALAESFSHVYAGIDIRAGTPGWIPDFVKVEVDVEANRCSITLIELEATESVARISCRKYLPESSSGIYSAVIDYLERVVRQCRSSADPRAAEFIRLKEVLEKVGNVTVSTAGALRSAAIFVEEFRLLDQPQIAAKQTPSSPGIVESKHAFHGVLRLSAEHAKALTRCIMVVDAVFRGKDHSVATQHAWRANDKSQPLKYYFKKHPGAFPHLRQFVLTSKNGVTVDFEKIIIDLAKLWSESGIHQIDADQARASISGYFPIALEINGHDKMDRVFDQARKHLKVEGIHLQ